MPVILIALALAGCEAVDQIVPRSGVTIYGRNAVAADAWFVLRPFSSPPEAVGFGPDPGVACLRAQKGSELVMTDRSPSQGGSVVRVLAPIDADVETLWVDVAADGSVATGDGVPPWWSGDPHSC